MKDADLEQLATVDAKTRALFLGATGALSGLDARLVPSVAATFSDLATTRLGNLTAIHEAAKAFEATWPIVAPQIAARLAEVLPRVPQPAVASYAERMKAVGTLTPAFNFTKALEDLKPAILQPRVAEVLQALALPASFIADMTAALRDLPRIEPADLAPRIDEAAEEAVALAEVKDVAQVVDQSIGRVERMTPAKRRMLAHDVVLLIAAFLTLAGLAKSEGLDNPKTAGAALVCAVTLIRVYWRYFGEVD